MHACVKHFGSSFRQIRNCARQIRMIDQLEAAFAAPLTCRRVRSVLRIVTKAWTASADGNCRSAIRVVSRGLPSSVFTFPLRARYLPPCPQAVRCACSSQSADRDCVVAGISGYRCG